MYRLIIPILIFVCGFSFAESSVVLDTESKTNGFYNVKPLYDIKIEHDTEYASGKKLDAYLPISTEQQQFSAIVMIHGGGWAAGTKRQAREVRIGKVLASQGYVCVDIDYILAKKGEASWPQCLYDCKNAVKFLRKHAKKYNVDKDRIGVMGGSAGGHLALMTAYTGGQQKYKTGFYDEYSDEVCAVIDLYGIANTLTWRQSSGTKLLGCGSNKNLTLWKEASPVFVACEDSPPTLIMHGTGDKVVGIAQSEELVEILKKNQIEHRFIVVKDAEHSFTFDSTETNLWPEVLGFLGENLACDRLKEIK